MTLAGIGARIRIDFCARLQRRVAKGCFAKSTHVQDDRNVHSSSRRSGQHGSFTGHGPNSNAGPCTQVSTADVRRKLAILERSEPRHRAECLVSRGQAAKPLAGVSATCSSFEMAEYRVCTSILILTIQARITHGFDGARTVSGESDDHPSGDFSGPVKYRGGNTCLIA